MKKGIAILLAFMMCVGLMACSSGGNTTVEESDVQDSSEAQNTEETTSEESLLKVGYACSNLTEEYFQALSESLEKVITEYGGSYAAYDGSAGSTTQINQIEDMIASGINVLVLTPVDTTALSSVLQDVVDAGILIVSVDAQVADEDLDYVSTTIVSNNYSCGVLIGEDLLERYGDEEVELMFDTVPTNEAITTRFQGIYDTLDGHDNFIIHDVILSSQGFAGLPNQVEDTIQAYPNTTVFVGLNDTAAMSMHAVAVSAGIDAVSYGIDGSPAGKQAIATGDLTCTIAQSPLNLGAAAGEAAITLFEGGEVEDWVEIDVVKIDASNIDDYDLESWQ